MQLAPNPARDRSRLITSVGPRATWRFRGLPSAASLSATWMRSSPPAQNGSAPSPQSLMPRTSRKYAANLGNVFPAEHTLRYSTSLGDKRKDGKRDLNFASWVLDFCDANR